ncbi:hypothetical protein AAHA92_26505 [Salvia divinorum]|uniref:S-protein homolog n=1 Tax=Salvia divinorum TaxID=28513 RepID=A0ABD1GE58_SALDI
MIKYSFFLLIASSFLLQPTASQPNCFLDNKYAVYIVSNLPPKSPPLQVHCISKDDDLGHHNLTQNVEYRFAFCEIAFVTMFSCRFRWNGHDRGFHVYDANWDYNRCRSAGICYYVVKSDGFYFTNVYPPKKVGFLCGWNPSSKC